MTKNLESPAVPADRSWRERLPDILTAAVAFVIWRVFFPALMSPDSVAQYEQAVTGNYNDWHPPLMAIVLKVVLASGGAIGILMLGQCLAGVFGVRALVEACLGVFYGGRIAPRRAEWTSLGVLLLLLTPLGPLPFYLMTFWKDAWAMVFLLWLGAFALAGLDPERARRRNLLGLAGAGAGLGLVRHNAVIVLPLVSLVLWMRARPAWSRPRALALAAAPLAIFLTATVFMDRVFDVQEVHTDSAVMALDLVGLCAESRPACDQLPWTRSHIVDPTVLDQYRPGDIGFIFWDKPMHVDPAIRADYPRLRAEYLRAVREYPWLLAKIKLEAFETLLGTRETYYFFHSTIFDNPYGLILNPRMEPVRRRMIEWTGKVAASPVARWVSGVHLVWIVVNVLWVVGLLAASFRPGGGRFRLLACVLLVPLGYYFSYLFASPAHDFRFMYPSTLMVQCVTLSWLAGGLVRQKPTGRAP